MDNKDPECNLINGTRRDLSIVRLYIYTYKITSEYLNNTNVYLTQEQVKENIFYILSHISVGNILIVQYLEVAGHSIRHYIISNLFIQSLVFLRT